MPGEHGAPHRPQSPPPGHRSVCSCSCQVRHVTCVTIYNVPRAELLHPRRGGGLPQRGLLPHHQLHGLLAPGDQPEHGIRSRDPSLTSDWSPRSAPGPHLLVLQPPPPAPRHHRHGRPGLVAGDSYNPAQSLPLELSSASPASSLTIKESRIYIYKA